jgi:hypothetical protein
MAERIDAHWHKHRLMSRAAAIRDILERGLSLEPQRSQSNEPSAQQHIQEDQNKYQGQNNLNNDPERRGQGQE